MQPSARGKRQIGNQTFNNATINLGNTSGYDDTIYNYDTNDTGSVLTMGPNVIVNQAVTSGYAELLSGGSNDTGDGIVNQGTINAQAANGSFYIEPYNFTNQARSTSPTAIRSTSSQALI